ncbi:MAG: response regulator, partial [Bacteroidota bacterium]
ATLHVLVIEDRPEDFYLLQSHLKKCHQTQYKLHHCETLKEGIDFLNEGTVSISVIVTDLKLPDSYWSDTLNKLQTNFPQYPIVLLTGLDQATFGQMGFDITSIKHGAQDFLDKNELNPALLDKTLRYAIERKSMMSRLEQAQALAGFGSWELHLEDQSMIFSPSLAHVLASPAHQAIDHLEQYLAIVHPEDQEAVRDFFQLFLSRTPAEALEMEHRLILADHDLRYIQLIGQAGIQPSHGPNRVVGTVRDLTKDKQIERLKREKELATQSAKLRQEFFAKTSHEIRTPLNPILLLTEMLLKTPLESSQREYIQVIKTAGETLLALVNDILDLSKIEAGKIKFAKEPFQLAQVVESIENLLVPGAHKKSLDLRFVIDPEIPSFLLGDSVRLSQILLNLISNSIKFTQEGSIQTQVKLLEKNQDRLWLRFEVKDSGIGIPENKLEEIFESFQQINSDSSAARIGTGLGLSIVKQLVSLQKGHIFVKSSPGLGSTFTFELPFEVGSIQARINSYLSQQLNDSDHQVLNNLRVLMVEDNPLNQMVTEKLLTSWEMRVDIANNGREGVEKYQSKVYDLVLMDVQMPEMDGYQATQKIRELEKETGRHIPIIALTANAVMGIDQKCIAAGMDDYLAKPIDIKHLFDKIVRYVKPEIPAQAPLVAYQGHKSPESPISQRSKEARLLVQEPLIQHRSMSYQTYTDLSYLNELTQGQTDTLKAAIQKFIDSTPEMLEQLVIQVKGGDYERLAKSAHKLKSSVAIMGMNETKDNLVQIESTVKNHGDTSQLPDLVAQVITQCQAGMEELQGALQDL